ncbi:MAG: autotransporter-associated beta strand repeat-containing protein [Kiritimatiellia bacterium]
MLNLLGPEAYVLSAGRAVNVAKNSKNLAGVVNLNSGTLRALRVYASSSASPSYVNFNGGTLRADVSRTDFLQGITAATVYPGGAVIDTTNVNVTAAQPLLAPTGYGVASIPLRGHGLGYIGAPTVLISGGQGTGATAIATVDLNPSSPTCGQVTGLTVTSPGFGYAPSDALTVTLRGGGYTNAAFAAAPLLAPNVSGGLTKLGSGTLTLGGASTYGGETVISNGTLKLGTALALPAASKVVLAGGTLDLGGYTVTNAVGGLGTLANGTLQTVISPAGEGALGAESLTVNGVALTGTYRCDVTETGASDHVTIAGSVGLSGLTLEIVDPESLSRSKVYTIATITGARTGGFLPDSRLDSRWRLAYAADGTVKLLFVDGTFMFLK